MARLSTLPRVSWLKRISITFACALIALALAALIGWTFDLSWFLQAQDNFNPMKANTAVGLLILGIVMLLFELDWRTAAWLALVPAFLGLLHVIQELATVDLGIDEFFVHDHLSQGGSVPGRMSPIVALTLTLVGIGLSSLAWPKFWKRRTLVLAIISSITITVGASTLLGYALELRTIYRWGIGSNTAPASAIGMMILGAGVLIIAWRETEVNEPGAPSWLPLPVVVGSATLTLILWSGLRQREIDYLGNTTQIAINSLAGAINLEMERQANLAERMARRWSQPNTNAVIWEVDATTHLAESPACQSVSLLGLNGETRWVYPISGNEYLVGLNHADVPTRRTALQTSRSTSAPSVSATLQLPPNDSGFAIYAPIFRDGEVAGFVGLDYAYRRLFGELVQRLKLAEDYEVRVSVGEELLYDSTGIGPVVTDRVGLDPVFSLFDRRIRINLVTSEEFFLRNRRFLPELALAAGLGITILIGLSVHLARAAYTSLRTAEISNRRLVAENEERRRVEAMLKVSDERLRLALDSTQIGIFEWNLTANQVYYSPGLWTMLGYRTDEIVTTPEAWTKLIHPDDIDGYRQAIESQLSGTEDFVEPEYRVRTGTGDWRWLYQRAKAVAKAASGAPSRIIGTLQDITERKLAEAALRESQATTRKLSLVASRTDNLVIIGSPGGTIEWVNESFTRVMEYKLEEIAGRNPQTFMVGRDTNPRTIRRIRAAMARGIGVSTDVVNYSKSGRKYHLHLEIQPVRSDNGGLETFIAILADITSRVETEQALRRAKAEADNASRAKSEFLASMSHEIRTPMNGVIGMTSLLMETRLDHEQHDFVNTIRTSGEALLTIINDILDFSKIESGKMELEHLPFDLGTCVEEAIDLFSMPAAAKKIELAYHLEDGVPPWIVGDITRLRQILVNLVNNAVKFTPGGRISIVVRRLDPHNGDEAHIQHLEFRVRDTGIGIPPDRLNRLFKPFSQVDSSTTRKFGGTGLGLAICHRLCQLMGGDIRVKSKAGEGSEFIFHLRLSVAQPPPAEPLKLPADVRQSYILGLDDNPVVQDHLAAVFRRWSLDYVPAPTAAAVLDTLAERSAPALLVADVEELESELGTVVAARVREMKLPVLRMLASGSLAHTRTPWPASVSLTKPVKVTSLERCLLQLLRGGADGPVPDEVDATPEKLANAIPLDVLLVEDNPVNQKVALRFLERLGYRADAVGNGIEAVQSCERRSYHLVLMDIQMPEMDGFTASREIRKRLPDWRQPRILALTANALQGDRELCMQAGMDDYLSKPIKIKDLSEAIRRLFADGVPTLRA